MRRWNVLPILTAIVLLAVLPAAVFAEDGNGLTLSLSADKSSAAVGENVTYIYFISNTGNVTMNNLTLEDGKMREIELPVAALFAGDNVTVYRLYTIIESDLPGPLVASANVTGIDPDGQAVFALSNSVSVALMASSDNSSDDGEPQIMTKAQILKLLGVPGKGIDTAPGLQKPFNPKSQAAMKLHRFLERIKIKEQSEVKTKHKAGNK